jgi:hypothetical protein
MKTRTLAAGLALICIALALGIFLYGGRKTSPRGITQDLVTGQVSSTPGSAPGLPIAESPGMANRLSNSPSVRLSFPLAYDSPAATWVAQLDALMGDIDRVDRAEQRRRWKAIDGLAYCETAVIFRLRQRAMSGLPSVVPIQRPDVERVVPTPGTYQRFVAAAHLAGFGRPARNLGRLDDTTLGKYLAYLRANSRPPGRVRGLRCDPAIEKLRIALPEGMTDRDVHEVMWKILAGYHLEFCTLPDDSFYIFSPSAATYAAWEGEVSRAPFTPLAKGVPPNQDARRDLDALLGDIEHLDRQERALRWLTVTHLAESDSRVRGRLRGIATGVFPAGPYQRFMAQFLVARLGRSLSQGPNRCFDVPLGQYVDRLCLDSDLRGEKRPIQCDGSLKDLRVTVLPAAHSGLQLHEMFWEILVKYHLGLRILPDLTVSIQPKDPISRSCRQAPTTGTVPISAITAPGSPRFFWPAA